MKLKELLEKLNPERKIKSKWHYIGVLNETTGISIYEVYFMEDGNFEGVTDTPSYPYGDSISEVLKSLETMSRDIVYYPLITEEERDFICKYDEKKDPEGLYKKLTQAEKDKGRSPGYHSMSPQEQWEEDKRLGILDWEEK